jgi:uncharacterized protein (TIGR04255 family)
VLLSESWSSTQVSLHPGQTVSDLPEFDDPPVVEVAVGVQFRPLFPMRGLALAGLRDQWLYQYPRIEEQPALPPTVEGSPPLMPRLQFNVVPLPPTRQWFLNELGTELVQVQPDRLLVNWRTSEGPAEYPRYGHMRETFVNRFNDLARFVAEEALGDLEITQAELTYINVIEVKHDDLGRIDLFLKGWSGVSGHHLGAPEQARVTLTFPIPELGSPQTRLYVEINPAQKPSGEPVLFFTLTARGNPGGKSLAEAMKFMDEAHDHLTRSFAELTEESMHEVWGRRS